MTYEAAWSKRYSFGATLHNGTAERTSTRQYQSGPGPGRGPLSGAKHPFNGGDDRQSN